MAKIKYMAGYKYQLRDDYTTQTGIDQGTTVQTPFIDLSSDGTLTIRAGYAWDGPSGPTIDTKNFMRGSLVHDALYQLMRQELIPRQPCRKQADRLLRQLCREDGMTPVRAWWVYQAVAKFGGSSAKGARETITAP